MENSLSGKLISAPGTCSDILYGSGFNAADEFTYFEVAGQKYIAVSVLEFSRALDEAKPGVKVLDRGDIIRALPKDAPCRDFFVALSRFCKVDRWIVPSHFPLACADTMRENGITVTAAKSDFFPERAVKSPDELEKIRCAERVTEECMHMVHDMIEAASVNSHGMLVRKNGDLLTSEFVRREIEAEFKRRSFTADRTIIAGGVQGSAPHCIGEGPLPAGKPVVCDIFPRSDESGYWGDMTRTFCKGKAEPLVRKAFEAVKRASERSLEVLRAGVSGSAVHGRAVRSLEDDGFHTCKNANGVPCGFFHGLGHGVGLDIHEQPRLTPSNLDPLPENAVVSVEPGLYDPEWGGIRLEDLVRVTAGGYENFCTMEKELEVR